MNESKAMSSSFKIGLAALLGVAFGLLLPHFFGHPALPSRAPKVSELAPVTVKLSDEDKSGLRALIHEELAQTLGAAKADSSSSTGDAGSTSAQSPAAASAYKAARATIDKQISQGSWSDSDSTQLRTVVLPLSIDARLEVIRPLVVAINEGRVRVEGRGPLF